MHLRDLADQFEETIRLRGHTVAFQTGSGTRDNDFMSHELDNGDNVDIMLWIRQRYRCARGAELPGAINPTLPANLFQQQTAAWETIANNYLEKVFRLTRDYVRLEVLRTEEDKTIRASLESLILSRMDSTEDSARRRLRNLLGDERGDTLQTVNHYYAETLDQIRRERVMAQLQAAGLHDETVTKNATLSGVLQHVNLSNEDQAIIDIHDFLLSYYKVAIKRFQDYVVISVVERMFGPDTALRFFSSEYVGGMENAQLAEMAAENYVTSSARADLQGRCERYREALCVAKSLG